MKNNKHILIVIIIISISILFVGCGKDYDGGGGSGPAPDPSQLLISSIYPSVGQSWVTTEGVTITFNNQIDTSKFDLNKVIFASDHNAGSPQPSLEVTWLLSNRSIKITPTQGWSSFETATELPIRVHLLDIGAFEDMYGNKLTSGETIANYYFPEEFWRWWPLKMGTVTQYSVTQETPGSLSLYYLQLTVRNNSAFSWLTSLDAYAKGNSTGGDLVDFGYFSASTNSDGIRSSLSVFPPTAIGDLLAFAPTVESVGATWKENVPAYIDPGMPYVTMESEVLSYNYIDTQAGTFMAYAIVYKANSGEGDSVPLLNYYYVYNHGVMKIEAYNTTTFKVKETFEAISFSSP